MIGTPRVDTPHNASRLGDAWGEQDSNLHHGLGMSEPTSTNWATTPYEVVKDSATRDRHPYSARADFSVCTLPYRDTALELDRNAILREVRRN